VYKWIHALTLVLALGAACPAAATAMTGTDGLFSPATDVTLPYRAGGLFDFTAIDIGSGVTVRFDTQMQDVTLRSLGDIQIAGAIDAIGIRLVLETPGQIVLTGSILADSILLVANGMLLEGNLGISPGTGPCIQDCGTLHPLPGRLPIPPGAVVSVPEPATVWLLALLLPLLARSGRRRA
jgi:hypothetical protein